MLGIFLRSTFQMLLQVLKQEVFTEMFHESNRELLFPPPSKDQTFKEFLSQFRGTRKELLLRGSDEMK